MKFGPRWKWVHNYAHSPKGRVWVGWLEETLEVQIDRMLEQVITVKVSEKANREEMLITFIYGLHSIVDRKELWVELEAQDSTQLPWVLVGDFNTVFDYDKRVNGNPITYQEVVDGQQCIQRLRLDFIKPVG